MPRLPYTNFHDINLNWFLREFKKIVAAVSKKQDAPTSPGTPGQVLGLGPNQTPVWLNQSGGVASYDELTGKPSVNGVTLSGEMEGIDLGLIDAPSIPGSAGQVLTSDGQGGQSWQTPVTPPAPGAGDYAPIIMDSASGPVASFPDGADGLYMPSLVAEIVPVQDGTGDPSPNNIRPISGRGGVTVYQTGKNLFNKDTAVIGKWLNVSTGAEENATINYALSDYIFIKANQNYIITNPNSARSWFYDVNKTPVQQINATNFNFPTDGYVRYTINVQTVNLDSVILALGTTLPAYTPFIEIEPILETWGDVVGSIYGGTIDIVSGVLTVNRAIVDLGTLNWSYDSQNQRFFTVDLTSVIKKGSSEWMRPLCSAYKSALGTTEDKTVSEYASTGYVYIKDSTYTDAATFKTALSGVQLVYETATTTNYQLTPQQVQTILGQNNIYSDSGNCSVTYRADTKLFILKVIA